MMFSADRLPVYTIASLYWRCLLCLASVYLHELCCLLLDAMSSDHPNEVFALFARTFSISRTVHSLWCAPRPGTVSFLTFAICQNLVTCVIFYISSFYWKHR